MERNTETTSVQSMLNTSSVSTQANEGRAWGETNESAACKYTLPHSLSTPVSCPTSKAPGDFKEVFPVFYALSSLAPNGSVILLYSNKRWREHYQLVCHPLQNHGSHKTAPLKLWWSLCVAWGHVDDLSITFWNFCTFSAIILTMYNNTALQTHTGTLAACADTLSLLIPNSQIPWYFLLALGPFRSTRRAVN